MGEVYRATDTKLKRQVAIKVLPDALAADPERLARFQREAEVLASLNHQNIAHLHGLVWRSSRRLLPDQTSPPRCLRPSHSTPPTGHLIYAARASLRAVGFDTDRSVLRGEDQATVLENVHVNQQTGAAYYGLAGNGTLWYYASPPATDRVTLALVDTAGNAQPLRVAGPAYEYPRVSRDGRWVAYQTEYSDGQGLAVFEIAGRTEPLRIAFGGPSQYPVWSADGRRIIFQSTRDGGEGLFWQRSDG